MQWQEIWKSAIQVQAGKPKNSISSFIICRSFCLFTRSVLSRTDFPPTHPPNTAPPTPQGDHYLTPPIPSPKTHTCLPKAQFKFRFEYEKDFSILVFRFHIITTHTPGHIPRSFHELPSLPNTNMKNYSIPYSYSKLNLPKWQPITFAF